MDLGSRREKLEQLAMLAVLGASQSGKSFKTLAKKLLREGS